MMFFFAIFLAFGLFSAAMFKEGFTGGFEWDAMAILVMTGAHAFFVLLGFCLVQYSRKLQRLYGKDGTLSRGGWIIALCVSFVVGFVGFLIADA